MNPFWRATRWPPCCATRGSRGSPASGPSGSLCQGARALANGPGLSHIESMPIPVDILRVVLGLLCLFFAHFLGRSIVRVRRGQRARSFNGWLIRTAITGGAILWRRGLDGIAIVAFTLAAASLVVGMWDEQRPKKQEDLTKEIFGGYGKAGETACPT